METSTLVFHEALANQCYIRDVTPGERGVPSDDVPVHGDRRGRVGFHKGGGLGDFVSKEVGLLRGDNFVRERGPASPTSGKSQRLCTAGRLEW